MSLSPRSVSTFFALNFIFGNRFFVWVENPDVVESNPCDMGDSEVSINRDFRVLGDLIVERLVGDALVEDVEGGGEESSCSPSPPSPVVSISRTVVMADGRRRLFADSKLLLAGPLRAPPEEDGCVRIVWRIDFRCMVVWDLYCTLLSETAGRCSANRSARPKWNNGELLFGNLALVCVLHKKIKILFFFFLLFCSSIFFFCCCCCFSAFFCCFISKSCCSLLCVCPIF